MEFLSAAEVVDRGKYHFLRVMLGIACVLDVLFIVIGILIGENVGVVPIILLLICVTVFRKMGDRKHIEDVRCTILETERDFQLVMFDIATDKEDVLSRSYRIDKKNFQVFADREKGMLDLSGDGNVKIFTQNGQIVYEEDYEEQVIELTVKENTFEELVSLLSVYIKQ